MKRRQSTLDAFFVKRTRTARRERTESDEDASDEEAAEKAPRPGAPPHDASGAGLLLPGAASASPACTPPPPLRRRPSSAMRAYRDCCRTGRRPPGRTKASLRTEALSGLIQAQMQDSGWAGTSTSFLPKAGGAKAMEFDRYGRLLLVARDKSALLADGAESVFDGCFKKSLSDARWSLKAANDSMGLFAFCTEPNVWLVDLEECEEAEVRPVTTLTGPTRGVTRVVEQSHQSGSACVVLASSKDGSLYMWDTRTGTTPVAVVSGQSKSLSVDNLPTSSSKRSLAASRLSLFSAPKRIKSDRGAVPTGARRNAAVNLPLVGVCLSGTSLFTARSDKEVALYDTRCLRDGALASVACSEAALVDDDGDPYLLGPQSLESPLADILPSPSHCSNAVVCLTQSGALFEVDVVKGVFKRSYWQQEPQVDPPADDEPQPPPAPVCLGESLRAAYIAELESFCVPARQGVAIVRWADKYKSGMVAGVTGEVVRPLNDGSFSPFPLPVVALPTPATCVAFRPEWKLISSCSDGLFRSSLPPFRDSNRRMCLAQLQRHLEQVVIF
ncbi:hypothetical protein DIPPA_18456 [Diplonema papillatum]|nr:hypothetical protein DIPPA_18456 [Diplonema papillatum]